MSNFDENIYFVDVDGKIENINILDGKEEKKAKPIEKKKVKKKTNKKEHE
jgi:hypothetical protein